MLYQLSYASAAQTNEIYQKGNENCKARMMFLSTPQTKAVEKPTTVSLPPTIIPFLINALSFCTCSPQRLSPPEGFLRFTMPFPHIFVCALADAWENRRGYGFCHRGPVFVRRDQ